MAPPCLLSVPSISHISLSFSTYKLPSHLSLSLKDYLSPSSLLILYTSRPQYKSPSVSPIFSSLQTIIKSPIIPHRQLPNHLASLTNHHYSLLTSLCPLQSLNQQPVLSLLLSLTSTLFNSSIPSSIQLIHKYPTKSEPPLDFPFSCFLQRIQSTQQNHKKHV
jgi:hypothetical protein